MSTQDLIKSAIEQYSKYHEVELRKQATYEEIEAREAESERADLREFLATLIPAELVAYAELDGFREAYAKYTSPTGNRCGRNITISVPECFPIYIRVYRRGDKYEHISDLFENDYDPAFDVPTIARAVLDEYGDEGYYISFEGVEKFGDFMTALGYAAVRGAELPALQEEVERLKEESKQGTVLGGTKDQRLSPEQRMVIALENIADGIAAMHLYNNA